ncbi:RagB/SusD family nutrient uptake outer membrane protein [Dyadobacter sediminis]|uniref:RagB/SusD family nutrient uptake outer membrane protein n=1 Tax=Dyadobacter sediminis TaxID=1493691 RepID=A0A5R9KID4_9BACT|nr:RagB/SusD family nutrient uptake outer membrane protein [Dyadobacter sediminis]TLU95866.1 RagB/SusD family nutrient uptake outer membrane protein [Dyadobacter sediminis]GGB77230.1 membrane protein [Dyadobacter sediminis]
MISKNIKIAVALVILAFSGTSCEEFLESKPISQIGETDFFKTESDFTQAVVGAYAALSQVYSGNGYYPLLVDLRSDNTSELVAGASGNDAKRNIDEFRETTDNEHLTAFWQTSYNLIARTNSILARIEDSPVSGNLKKQYTGESLTMRALAYFNLVRLFGGVPLVTEPVTDIDASYKVGRASVQEVYALIEADLAKAQELVPATYDDTNVGRATKGAAQSLLGQVYLTQKKYAEAAAEFKKVVTSGTYSLLPVYADLYKAGQQGNAEAIWQAQYKGAANGLGSNLPNHFAPTGSEGVTIPSGGAYGFNQPTDDIAAAYSKGDVRRNNIADGYTLGGAFIAAKYVRGYVERETGGGYADSGTDWYIIRYADILLMYAEALNEANKGPVADAYAAVNLVRKRAGLSDLAGLTYETFKAAVYNEERLESPFEGHRWFDLLRTDRAMTVMNAKVSGPGKSTVGISTPIQAYQLLYPIPALAVITSSPAIVQNEGY